MTTTTTTTAHVYFADVPLSPVASQEGHRSTFAACDDDGDDATPQQRQTRDGSISPVAPPDCCTSPVLSTSPRYERNMGFFRQLSRRFGLRSTDDLVYSGSNEDDNQSSSTDSCSSHVGGAAKVSTKELPKQFTSCNSSETSSTVDIEEQQTQLREREQQQPQQNTNTTVPDASNDTNDANDASGEDKPLNYHRDRKSFARSSFSRLQRRSTNSIRRAFEAFSLSSRSLSCSGAAPPVPPPPPLLSSQSHTSSASSSTNNGTPIKSALKSSSNLELNKKSATFAIAANPSSFRRTSSTSAASAAAAAAATSSTSSSKTKTKPPPQRILRQPVSYTYLKGISGLPTQRVPRNAVCCQYVRR